MTKAPVRFEDLSPADQGIVAARKEGVVFANNPRLVANSSVKKILKKIKDVKEDIRNLQFDESQFKKDLAAEVGNIEVIIDEKDHVIATWSFNETHRFDIEAFKDEHPEMYILYLKASRERRLIIKK